MGALVPETESVEFETRRERRLVRVARDARVRLFGDLLADASPGATLDALFLFDLPPGAERTFQYAEFSARPIRRSCW